MSSNLGAAIPDAAQANQKQGQAILVWTVGAFCIYGWDWILCLPREYQCIWRKKLTPISVLYLVNRYFGFIQLCIVVSLMATGWSPSACKSLFYWDPVGFLISTLLSQMILGVRVYAIYSQSRVVLIVLSLIFLLEVCLGGIAIKLTSPLEAGPSDPKLPCNAIPAPLGWMIAYFSIQVFFDMVTFLLTAGKIYDTWKKEVDSPLISVIWRDGISYFFAICTMNFINVLIFLIAPNSLTWVANLTPTVIFTITLSCRLVLNLRDTLTNANAVSLAGSSGPMACDCAKHGVDYKGTRTSPDNTFRVPKSEWDHRRLRSSENHCGQA